ncbi:helix-turn-helix transcriptional regulator [Streptomyces sp. NPDC057101]|uniref:helix-turn-helix domain-containing protein n=1 Tax=Streptomyces sp. NPDC057101 TaxID=3346020 RepID=UPI003639DD41
MAESGPVPEGGRRDAAGCRPGRPLSERPLSPSGGRRRTGARRSPGHLVRPLPRERDIARLVGMGWTNREVASEPYLSAKTVEYHLSKHLREVRPEEPTSAAGPAPAVLGSDRSGTTAPRRGAVARRPECHGHPPDAPDLGPRSRDRHRMMDVRDGTRGGDTGAIPG